MIIIESIAPPANQDAITRIAKRNDVADYWVSSKSDKQIAIKMLVEKARSQKVLDQLQTAMAGKTNFRVISYPLEVALPYQAKTAASVSREALLNQLSGHAQADGHFLMLTLLSTVVAAIGLMENNVAVIIGAMVIAPLLGPNLALSLATTLGNLSTIVNAIKTLVIGVGIAIAVSVLIGWFYPTIVFGHELLSRTTVGLDSLALALASGAAAALSITTGVSSVLVGVMVAVALLPPAVTLGISLGMNQWLYAQGAGLLLVANIASVNLTAQLVMRFKGITPRSDENRAKALLIFLIGLLIWIGLIAYLIVGFLG
ncbi:TIGR00341 family protein [Bermanella sp. R86510]|uniref:TIGR00341 family protein n=1 Tax=unclassified Bermanella TaxID=2627862 RepID=UPI0037C7DD4A